MFALGLALLCLPAGRQLAGWLAGWLAHVADHHLSHLSHMAVMSPGWAGYSIHRLPSLERSELLLHLDQQTNDSTTGPGMVAENFGGSPLDTVCAGARGDDNAVVIADVFANVRWRRDGLGWLRQSWPKVRSIIQWQLRQAVQLGTMPAYTNTFDEARSMGVGGTNSWNSFLHLVAVRAAEELATQAGDSAVADQCAAAARRAREVIVQLLWDSDHSRFRGYVCNASDRGVLNTDNLMADSLVGVLWAHILGIDLGMNRTMFELHQRASFAVANEFGLPFWSNKTRDYACQPLPGNQKADKFTDDTIWSAHSVDEGALALFLGKVPTGEALAMARKSFDLYSTALADAYDFRDVSAIRDDGPRGTAGARPYCNSHYTRHLLGLHAIPLALSGQRYDATAQSMSFRPRREPLAPGVHDHSLSFRNDSALRRWPFFTPQGSGIVQELQELQTEQRGAQHCVRVRVLSGSLTLRTLLIDGRPYGFEQSPSLQASATGKLQRAVKLQPGLTHVACAGAWQGGSAS
eukprot:COSAG01_NODE_579_length_15238_cov_10.570183_2_plen_521_part_00